MGTQMPVGTKELRSAQLGAGVDPPARVTAERPCSGDVPRKSALYNRTEQEKILCRAT